MYLIRQANRDDVEILVQLRLELLKEMGHLTPDDDRGALCEATRHYFMKKIPTGAFLAWLAEVNGCVVASSGLIFIERPPSVSNPTGLEGYILNMYTLPEWRGQGIATALMQEILRFMRQTPSRRVRLHATPVGRPIYEKLGFVPNGREMEFSW